MPQQWLMPEEQKSSRSCKSLLSAEVWAMLEWAYAMLFLESCPGNSCLPQLGSPPGSLHFPLTPENLWPKLTEDVIEICTLANSVIDKGAVSSASSYGPLERLERPISFFFRSLNCSEKSNISGLLRQCPSVLMRDQRPYARFESPCRDMETTAQIL